MIVCEVLYIRLHQIIMEACERTILLVLLWRSIRDCSYSITIRIHSRSYYALGIGSAMIKHFFGINTIT